MSDKFIHFHTHSHFSLLDGLTSPKEMAKYAKELGFKSLALTDHGTCGGLYNFQKACKDNGIKPILGMEAYSCADHLERDKNEKFFHIILLAKNSIGLKNLMQLATISELKGKYRKPRIDFNLLSKYHEGLIVTSACSAGEIPQLLSKNSAELKNVTGKYKDLFGDDFYIEIMKHKYFKSNQESADREKYEDELAVKLYRFAKEMGIKAIATNDIHYARKTDNKYHDILLAMQTKDTIKNPERFTFDSDDFYMKSYDEMLELYKETPELLSNTVEIGEKVDDTSLFKSGQDLLPIYKIPDEFNSDEAYLKRLVKDGMIAKGLIEKPEYRERVKFEMDVIVRCGYIRYFLVLWDIMNYARRSGIATGTGRGCFLPNNKVKCIDSIKFIQDVKIGDKVLSYDKEYHEVINTMAYDVNEEIIEIDIDDGRSISCTLDHKIHVNRNGKAEWVCASDLNINDDIIDLS